MENNVLDLPLTNAQLDFYKQSTERQRQKRDNTMILNFDEQSRRIHEEKKKGYFLLGKPFYTEINTANFYKKEYPDGLIEFVKRTVNDDGSISDEIIPNFSL